MLRKSMFSYTEIAMVGKVLAQYQISERLGEAGMGVVSKPRGTQLDRFVALKTLLDRKVLQPY